MTEPVTDNFDDFDDALAQRASESAARKDDTGKFRSILKESEGLKIWRPGEGTHSFDAIPYRTGRHDPRLAEGSPAYVLDIWVHYNVGATEDSFVCPARTYSEKKNPLHTSERCPICESQNELRKELERIEDPDEIKAMEDKIKSLNPRRRVLYNVLVISDQKEEEKGCQVYDVAHWSMERHLSILSEKKRGSSGASVGGHMAFASPKKGKNITFSKKGKGMQTEFLGHRFEDRDPYYEITPELLKTARKLDEEIIIPTYDDLYMAFHGVAPGEVLPTSAITESSKSVEEDIPSDRVGGQAASTGRRFGTSTPVESAPETPVETQSQTATTEPTTEPVTTGNKCPKGAVFGQDEGKVSGPDGCRKCPDGIWQECALLSEKATKEESPTEPESTGRKLQRA